MQALLYMNTWKEDIGGIAEQMKEALEHFLKGLQMASSTWSIYSTCIMYGAEGTDQVCSLATLQEEVHFAKQGVYAAIVHSQGVKVYIGSSYGFQGLQNRVFSNHLNPAYRCHYTYRAPYKAMNAPGAVTHFNLLAAYETWVERPQVLLTEAVYASLFGSFRTKVYRSLRIEGLPSVNWASGLNRSDPLVVLVVIWRSVGQTRRHTVVFERWRMR